MEPDAPCGWAGAAGAGGSGCETGAPAGADLSTRPEFVGGGAFSSTGLKGARAAGAVREDRRCMDWRCGGTGPASGIASKQRLKAG